METKEKLIKSLLEGILGYWVYLSKGKVSEAYSEYLFYEPIIRMVNHRNYEIKSEVTVIENPGRGDNPKIDFSFIEKKDSNYPDKIRTAIGIEIKFSDDKKKQLDLEKDILKLNEYEKKFKNPNIKIEKYIIIIGKFAKQEEKIKNYKLNSISKNPITFKCTNKTYEVQAYKIKK